MVKNLNRVQNSNDANVYKKIINQIKQLEWKIDKHVYPSCKVTFQHN